MKPDRARKLPSIAGLRDLLIPTNEQQQWDQGELPQAVLNLDSQAVLSRCEVLLRLAVVERRCLDDTTAARVMALRGVLRELLPRELDHPLCDMLRALAGLAQGAAGRRRSERQEAAGRALGEGLYVVNPRSVRRRARQHAWPWLVDRLIEQELHARKALEGEEYESLRFPRASLPMLPGDASHAPSEALSATNQPPLQGPPFPYGPAPVSVAWPPAASGSMPSNVLPGLDGEFGPPWQSTMLLAGFQGGTLDGNVNRRTFLLGIPAVLLVSRPRLQLPGDRGEAAALNPTVLDELAAAVATDKRLCNQLGGRAVYGLVTEHATPGH